MPRLRIEIVYNFKQFPKKANPRSRSDYGICLQCPGAVDLTEKEGWLKYRLDAEGIAMMADSTD